MTSFNRRSAIACLLGFLAVSALLGIANAQSTLMQGSFKGLNGHATSGDARIVETDNGHAIVLGQDFSFDSAPDAKVALGKDGQYDPDTLIAPLRANSGEQSYPVPASIDVAEYNEVYIWCERFSVGLGVATLN